MTIQRVAAVFDNLARPETTGFYCRRALGELVAVEHFLPSEIGTIPRDDFDLFVNVDDGLDYRWPTALRPSIFWAIDTHLAFERTLARAGDFDLVFAAQKDGAESLCQAGIDATWLPLACDPAVHNRHDVPKQHDVCFIGNVIGTERERLVRLLQHRFPETLVDRRYFEAMAHAYSASRMVFNRSLTNDLNMRVFEALACGSLLVTNNLADNGQADLFQDGVHLAAYRSDEELLDKVAWYLAHEDARETIAAAGRAEALSKHTYRHRMQHMLQAAESATSRVAVAVPAHGNGRSNGKPVKDASYFQHARPDVLALVPESARNVLDVGCGAGRLGEALKQRQPAHVTGVELDPVAAESARARLDTVVACDVENGNAHFAEGEFDCVVCADVLEHLRQPKKVLQRIHRWLKPGGTLVASLPNVRHHTVVRGLLAGNWTYESAGLLDEDHVRFFTRREIQKLIFRTGFALPELSHVSGPDHKQWVDAGRTPQVDIGGMQLQLPSSAEAEEFFVYQYLLTAKKQPAPGYGLTSIVIACHNELACTRQCVDSIRLLTDEPYELIVIDNGSTDGTPAYLASLSGAAVITNRENRGFPAAANQGLEASQGEQVLLLNNDTLATTGWLRRMLDTLHRDPAIGLVGPCSNNVSGPQQVPVGYHDLSELDGFAWERGLQLSGRITDLDRLVGFCLLIRRDVIDRVGGFDERFGIGNFEDDDFCRRAKEAGFRAVVAEDAFVHHFGSRTFQGIGVDFAGLLKENAVKYREKWSQPVAQDAETTVTPQPPTTARTEWQIDDAGDGPLKLKRNTVKLSLCMIVRDNEDTIRPALESIAPWVGEMIVVDTGSTDRTPEICAELGARMFEFPWCDDFSAARNESVRHARGEWVFWMDSDDTIPEACGRTLRELVDSRHPDNVLGYVMPVHCPGESGSVDMTVVDHVKLFRNRPDLRFEHRIHEQILPAIRRAEGDVAFTDIHVVHSGSDRSRDGQARKRERDFRILAKDLAERPDHPFVLFNLGMTHADAEQSGEAIRYLKRCLQVSKPEESHLRKAYALLVSSLAHSERFDEAWDASLRGLALCPDDKEILFRQAMLSHHFGRLEEAEATYRKVLSDPVERYFSSLDPGLQGYKARHNLAIVYSDMGEPAKEERELRQVVVEAPFHRPAWELLFESLLKQKRERDAEQLAAELSRHSDAALRVTGAVLLAKMAVRKGNVATAVQRLGDAIREAPNDPQPRNELARILFEHADPRQAEPLLDDLARMTPDDPSVWTNLGAIYLKSGRFQRAMEVFRESLRLRPKSEETAALLRDAKRLANCI
ncbi:MAG: glycosyltransferase [Planctomycetaceae bacterium]